MFKKMRLALRKKTENGICHSSFLDLSCGLTYSLAARSSFFTSANLAAEIAPRLSVADFSLTSSITPRMSIVGSDRNETIYGTAESDVIHGLGGDDVIMALEGNDVVYGGTGNDKIYGHDGNDILFGEDGSDHLYGGNGNDELYGGNGNDLLDGGEGDDLLVGGSGDDTLVGGRGSDTYVYGRNCGNDTITELYDLPDDQNTLILYDLNPDGVEFYIETHNIGNGQYMQNCIMKVKETGETLTINAAFHGRNRTVQIIEFGNGAKITWEQLLANMPFTIQRGTGSTRSITTYNPLGMKVLHGTEERDILNGNVENNFLYGHGGNDELNGDDGDDYLDGGAGDDILIGGTGSDTFVFGKGYGHDKVYATTKMTIETDSDDKHDKIKLVGLTRDDVEFCITNQMSGNTPLSYDFVVKIKETGETMTVVNGMTGFFKGIQSVEFADGSVMYWAEIKAGGFITLNSVSDQTGRYYLPPDSSDNVSIMGGEGNDYLYGNQGDNILIGGGGNNWLYGYGGNDYLVGGNGTDYIYGGEGDDILFGGGGIDNLEGGAGDDILEGGTGDDRLTGGEGNDTYIFRAGDGKDTIANIDNSIGDDLLKLEGFNPEDLWFKKSGYHLIISMAGSQDSVTVNNWYTNDFHKIGTIETEGATLIYDQVGQMVQAMATLGAPGGSGGNWTDEQREGLAPIISAYWQPKF